MAYRVGVSSAILGRPRSARRPRRVFATRPPTLREIVAKSSAHALLLTLARRGRGAAVHEDDAVVKAHREHGARFALSRHPEVPDAGVVRAELVRLVRRGYVRRVRAKVLRVTAQGRRAAFGWGR